MTLIVPDVSEGVMLDVLTGKSAVSTWTLRLYTAAANPLGPESVAGDFTEAAGGGYAPIPLIPANWTTTVGTPSRTVYPLQTFLFTGPLTTNPNILGYYVTYETGEVVYVEALASPFHPLNNGDALDVTLTLTLGSISND